MLDYISNIGEFMGSNHVRIEMDSEPLSLWFAYPEELLNDATAEAWASILSEEERASWKSFRFERHRREYLTTRALVRTALSQYHPLAPEAWCFQSNAHGKPTTNPNCGLQFNLSNSPALVVCLIARETAVGVDAEPFERAEKIGEVASLVFSSEEFAKLETLRGHERLDRALSLWTLKEAYIKARGTGMSSSMKGVSFLFGGTEGIRLNLDPSLGDEAQRWRFCLLEHAGHRIALMVERVADFKLQRFEMCSLKAPAKRLPGGAEQWYPKQPEDCTRCQEANETPDDLRSPSR